MVNSSISIEELIRNSESLKSKEGFSSTDDSYQNLIKEMQDKYKKENDEKVIQKIKVLIEDITYFKEYVHYRTEAIEDQVKEIEIAMKESITFRNKLDSNQDKKDE